MNITIIDYGVGNLFSVSRAIEVLGHIPNICKDPKLLGSSDKIILPGVGAFGAAMRSIKEHKLDIFLEDFIQSGGSLLGICLGMQLFMSSSEEFGFNKGLDFIEGNVKQIRAELAGWPSLNVGWRELIMGEANLFEGQSDTLNSALAGKHFYYTHSFQVDLKNQDELFGSISYAGHKIPAVISGLDKNVIGVQFHPEKSGQDGLHFLKSFIEM